MQLQDVGEQLCNSLYEILDQAIFGRLGSQEAKDMMRLKIYESISGMKSALEAEHMQSQQEQLGYLSDELSPQLEIGVANLNGDLL